MTDTKTLVQRIRNKAGDTPPAFGLILGSGLGHLAEAVAVAVAVLALSAAAAAAAAAAASADSQGKGSLQPTRRNALTLLTASSASTPTTTVKSVNTMQC